MRLPKFLLFMSTGFTLALAAEAAETAVVHVSVRETRPAWIAVFSLTSDTATQEYELKRDTKIIDVTLEKHAPALLCAGAENYATQCRRISPESGETEELVLEEGVRAYGHVFAGKEPGAKARLSLSFPRIESRRPLSLPLARVSGKLVYAVTVASDGT